jgi:hypothetical protein
MKVFIKNGIYVEATWNVFDALIGKDYTKAEMMEIQESTEDGVNAMQELLEVDDAAALGMRPTDIARMKEVVDNKEWVLSQCAKRM